METQKIEAEAGSLVVQSGEIVVTDSLEYEAAAGFLKGVKTYLKRVGEAFDGIISKAHAAHKEAVAQKKRHEKPAKEAEATVKNKMLTWRRTEDEKARREALEKEAAARKAEEERKLAEAEALADAGDEEAADAVLEEPVVVAPVAPVQAAPKVAGISVRKRWSFRVVNEAKVPRDFLLVDTKKLGGYARSMKAQAKVEGVEFFEVEDMAAGAK